MNSIRQKTDLLTEEWERWKEKTEERLDRIRRFDEELETLLKKHGFKSLEDYQRRRSTLYAQLLGRGRPLAVRRKTKEDEARIRDLVREGRRTKEIAEELGLSMNTVSNVKRILKDRKELGPEE